MPGPWRRLLAIEDVADVRIATQAELSVTVTDGLSAVVAGEQVTYTITVANAGPDSVSGATVNDAFPVGLTCTWTCVGANGGVCAANGSGAILDTVTLPTGGSVTYTAVCAVAAGVIGTVGNTASVTAPSGVVDATPGDDSATDTDTVCTVTLTPPNQVVPAGGNVATAVFVTTVPSSGCAWTAGSSAAWVTLTPPTSGNGNGGVSYDVAANAGPNPRRGALTIAGKRFLVSQRTPVPPPCTITIPSGTTVGNGAGGATLALTASTGSCAWSVRSHVPWLTITSAASGSGSSTVTYTFTQNTTASVRRGRITVNGKRYTVTQNP